MHLKCGVRMLGARRRKDCGRERTIKKHFLILGKNYHEDQNYYLAIHYITFTLNIQANVHVVTVFVIQYMPLV